ncbi:MAG: hypothetical protein ORO03_02585 [Alphaproteobacteria bacterium]|nr:hypothetical protein [Alphaproteobacteria bacterium]
MSLKNVASIATLTLLVTFGLIAADKLGIIHLRPAHQQVSSDTTEAKN